MTTHVRATAGPAVFPVGIVAAVQAGVAMAISFGWLSGVGLSGQVDTAVAVLVLNAAAAVFLAYRTHATLLAPLVELFKALIVVGVVWGLHLTNEQTGLVIVFVTALFSAFHHTQVTPLQQGNFSQAA